MGKEQTKMIKAILIASLATVALAEAEADPYIAYSGLRYGLGGYYGGLGYNGKRSADAEPEAKADADPYLVYGGLGYAGYCGLGYYGVGGYYGKRSADAEAEADPYYTY